MNEQGIAGITVLCVEDEKSTREQMVTLLERKVKQVIAAENGEQGLELYKTHSPDIVITDILMPVMDGLQMAKEIKAIDWGTKIIVITAYCDASYLFSAIEADIDGYLTKPVDIAKLFNTIQKHAEFVLSKKAKQRYEEEREKLLVELQAALDKVKVLSGLIPICASCKKIRDDKGFWNQLESYLSKHSDISFSHGLCPNCAEKAFKEIEKLKK